MPNRTRILILLAAVAILPACSFFAESGPAIDQAAAYSGPAVEFDSSSARTHIVRITCPTGGWSATHDLTREGWPTHEVFITLVAPAEGAMVTQALTTLLVDTQVRSGAPCRVYIRTTDHAPGSIADDTYRLAASVEPR